MKTNQAIEVYREVFPAKYEWTPAKFVSRVGHKVTVAREGMTCDAGGVNPRPYTFIEVYTAAYAREAAMKTPTDVNQEVAKLTLEKIRTIVVELQHLPNHAFANRDSLLRELIGNAQTLKDINYELRVRNAEKAVRS